MGVPILEKLAVHPALTTQSVLPSDMVQALRMRSIKDTSLDVWQAAMHNVWLRDIPLLLLLGLVIYMSGAGKLE